jgi:hypothetical protein
MIFLCEFLESLILDLDDDESYIHYVKSQLKKISFCNSGHRIRRISESEEDELHVLSLEVLKRRHLEWERRIEQPLDDKHWISLLLELILLPLRWIFDFLMTNIQVVVEGLNKNIK